MKIDIDLNKITDLNEDAKKALRENKKEIDRLKNKLKFRESQIDNLKFNLEKSENELKEFVRLKSVLQEFFNLGKEE